MSAYQGSDQGLSFAKGVTAARVVEALHEYVLVGMFGRLSTLDKVSDLSTHAWPKQYFKGTANTSSDADVTAAELLKHFLTK